MTELNNLTFGEAVVSRVRGQQHYLAVKKIYR